MNVPRHSSYNQFLRWTFLFRGFLSIFLIVILTVQASLGSRSQVSPLAEKSLLLDGQVVGDSIVVVGERGHILVSVDHGHTWQQQPAPTQATLTSVFFIDSQRGWAAGHDSVILHTTDGGKSWTEVYSDPAGERPVLDLWFNDSLHGYAVGAYGLFLVTRDGGRHWDETPLNPATLVMDANAINDPWEERDVWIDFHLNQIHTTHNGRVFVAAEAGNIYRSDDGCRSWISLPSPYDGSFYGTLSLGRSTILLYGLRGHLFLSSDYGVTWNPIESKTLATINDGIQLKDGRIALAGLAGTLLVGQGHGQSFELFAQSDRAGISKILQAHDGALLLIGEAGIKRVALSAISPGESP